jgi:hypothetical protein
MGTTPTPVQQLKQDLAADKSQITAAEVAFLAEMRVAVAAGSTDVKQLLTDAAAAKTSLWTALVGLAKQQGV